MHIQNRMRPKIGMKCSRYDNILTKFKILKNYEIIYINNINRPRYLIL